MYKTMGFNDRSNLLVIYNSYKEKAIVKRRPIFLFLKTHLINIPKWRETVSWMNKVRPWAWYWFQDYQERTCAIGKRGRLIDQSAFETFQKEIFQKSFLNGNNNVGSTSPHDSPTAIIRRRDSGTVRRIF